MLIKQLTLENFRCFAAKKLDFESNFVVLQGNNGAGKTSILEALHYACYLRSFRTHQLADLLLVGQPHLFIKLQIHQPHFLIDEKIQVGLSSQKEKVITLNESKIQDYRQLLAHYRVVTLTAEDVALVSGAPEYRRDFLNVGLMLQDREILSELREHRRLVELRNSYLEKNPNEAAHDGEFEAWTRLLWQRAKSIQQKRIAYLNNIEASVNELLQRFFSKTDTFLSISLQYQAKGMGQETFELFWREYSGRLLAQEQRYGRTMFGAHLDDFHILFDQQKARIHASRGQQKLITYLIKIVQVTQTIADQESAVFLIDDFLTDFDTTRAQQSLNLIRSLQTQIIITVPAGFSTIFSTIEGGQYIQVDK